jgi:2-polyprenyl-3-methyl-5-hydroxy-6-metoxy-1,4-benzoquinol methylase
MKPSKDSLYPGLKDYAKEVGTAPELLIEAFQLEKYYHDLLIKEKKASKRTLMYEEFYSKLLQLYGRNAVNDQSLDQKIRSKDSQVKLFEHDIKNKSIIDFGCGEGLFLMNIKRNLPYKFLTGVDVYIPDGLKNHPDINFISSGIIRFETKEKFDIAFSDNVLEHLSPLDLKDHLKSVYESLVPGGHFIMIMPNRLFGPMDITRIVDNTSSGKIKAQGGHLNESTYHEMINDLSDAGFHNFKTVFPIPKFKYSIFNKIRINTNWIVAMEKSSSWLRFFRSIRINGRCLIRFTVTLKCQKPY